MKQQFDLTDYNSFLIRFMLSFCPKSPDMYEILSCKRYWDIQAESLGQSGLRVMSIVLSLREKDGGCPCLVCFYPLEMSVELTENCCRGSDSVYLGYSLSGQFFSAEYTGFTGLCLESYRGLAYTADEVEKVFQAYALLSGEETIRAAVLDKRPVKPVLFNGNCGYAMFLDDEQALFVYVLPMRTEDAFVFCPAKDLTFPEKGRAVQCDGLYFYSDGKLFHRRKGKYLTAKEVLAMIPQIRAEYPRACFWKMPIPYVFVSSCWLVGEVFEHGQNAYLLVDLETQALRCEEISVVNQYGGIASPSNEAFLPE